MAKLNEKNELNKGTISTPPHVEPMKLNKTQLKAIELGMVREDVLKIKEPALLKSIVDTMIANKIVVNTSETPDAPAVKAPEYVETPLEQKLDEQRWMSKKQKMKDFFDAQPKVSVMIPLEAGEKPGVVEIKRVRGFDETVVVSGAVWSKTFNGYRVVVPKGVYTEVARGIAENLSQELNQTLTAGDQWKLDRIDPNTGKPVREQLS